GVPPLGPLAVLLAVAVGADALLLAVVVPLGPLALLEVVDEGAAQLGERLPGEHLPVAAAHAALEVAAPSDAAVHVVGGPALIALPLEQRALGLELAGLEPARVGAGGEAVRPGGAQLLVAVLVVLGPHADALAARVLAFDLEVGVVVPLAPRAV